MRGGGAFVLKLNRVRFVLIHVIYLFLKFVTEIKKYLLHDKSFSLKSEKFVLNEFPGVQQNTTF